MGSDGGSSEGLINLATRSLDVANWEEPCSASEAAGSNSAYVLMKHPKSTYCYSKRAEYIVAKGKVLHPSATQKFTVMKPDFARLVAGRPATPFGQQVLGKTESRRREALQRREELERARARLIAVESPPREAVAKRAALTERFDSSKLSVTLQQAIQGQRDLGRASARPRSASGGRETARENMGVSFCTEESDRVLKLAYRNSCSVIGTAEYNALRTLFTEIGNSSSSGYLELNDLIAFRLAHPRRLADDVFKNLTLNNDGKVFFDEFIHIHFPKVPRAQIESAIEQLEPKSQNIDALLPETKAEIEKLYYEICDMFKRNTFASWEEQASSCTTPQCLSLGLPQLVVDFDASSCGTKQRSARSPSAASKSSGSILRPPTQQSRRLSRQTGHAHTNKLPARSAATPLQPALETAATSGTSSPTMNMYQLYLFFAPEEKGPSFLGMSPARFVSMLQGHSVQVQLPTVISRCSVAAGAWMLEGPVLGNGEPNVPYMLSVPISLAHFTTICMADFVKRQNGEEIEMFIPNLEKKLESYRWERMFPYTSGYYRRLQEEGIPKEEGGILF